MRRETKREERVDRKDLDAWKQSMVLVEDIYKLTADFPKEEVYGLTAQVRRAAVSVPSNLSEGSGKKSSKEFLNFLSISLGSIAELETQLHIVSRLGYANVETVRDKVNRVRALILGLRNSIRRKYTSRFTYNV